jgi:type II secretory ATPase GspE/PulE/Tfp pilus assembly ATPase PilB-like protein
LVYVSRSNAVHVEPAIYSDTVRLRVMSCVREFTRISENLGGAILTAIKIFQGKYSLLRNAI